MPNQIHPTAILSGDVLLGADNVIHPYSVLVGPLEIGNNNIIGPHVCIGTPGQDTRVPRYDCSRCLIRIGSNNIIREFSSIEKPRYRDITVIGDDTFIMASCHLSHDAVIEDRAVITSMVTLAGVTRVMEGANIGMGAAVHQFSVIGPYSIVGLGCTAVKNVRPFSICIPGRPLKVNEYAVSKYGFGDQIDEIRGYILEGTLPTNLRVRELIERYQHHNRESGRSEYP